MGRPPWRERLSRLCSLLGLDTDSGTLDDELAKALDDPDLAASEHESQKLRFGASDLVVVSPLEKGQFGVVEVVQCRLDNAVYARKRIQKTIANKFRDHCFVNTERDILLRASLTSTPWAPHLLSAFQTPDALHLVMDFAEGGNLWDILESASAMDSEGKSGLGEPALKWWVPQAVSAIGWCHEQGFAHRDIKPHNFVITNQGRLQLIDFGCAAPLLQSNSSPSSPSQPQPRAIPKPYCLVPIGTCDYISPEILQAHEDALFAAEMNGDYDASMREEGYGCETDWWSLGAVIYELASGQAPFFASSVRQTYELIVEHERTQIAFDDALGLSSSFKDLVRRFLSSADDRIGRLGAAEIEQHAWFVDTNWTTLHLQHPPPSLMLPPSKAINVNSIIDDVTMEDESKSNPFDFSHLFKSTPGSSRRDISCAIQGAPTAPPVPANIFPNFSWGPRANAFDNAPFVSSPASMSDKPSGVAATPLRDMHNLSSFSFQHPHHLGTPAPTFLPTPATRLRPLNRPLLDVRFSDPLPVSSAPLNAINPNRFTTPVRPPFTPHAQSTIPLPIGFTPLTGTARRPGRTVSDREALRQMIVCVSASARKKVLESGRKPRFISTSGSLRGLSRLASPALEGFDPDASVPTTAGGGVGLGLGLPSGFGADGGGRGSGAMRRTMSRPKIPSLQLSIEPTDTMTINFSRTGPLSATLPSSGLNASNPPIITPSLPSFPSSHTIPSLSLSALNDAYPPSESMNDEEESAPPSPSPRPGSSLSRRSASPYPYPVGASRSSAPSPMLELPYSRPGSVIGGSIRDRPATQRSRSGSLMSAASGHSRTGSGGSISRMTPRTISSSSSSGWRSGGSGNGTARSRSSATAAVSQGREKKTRPAIPFMPSMTLSPPNAMSSPPHPPSTLRRNPHSQPGSQRKVSFSIVEPHRPSVSAPSSRSNSTYRPREVYDRSDQTVVPPVLAPPSPPPSPPPISPPSHSIAPTGSSLSLSSSRSGLLPAANRPTGAKKLRLRPKLTTTASHPPPVSFSSSASASSPEIIDAAPTRKPTRKSSERANDPLDVLDDQLDVLLGELSGVEGRLRALREMLSRPFDSSAKVVF